MTTTHKIDLSICIPTLQRADFIGETLQTIVEQMTDRVELVIVDGGSNDGTEEIVKGFQQQVANIEYYQAGDKSAFPSGEGFDRDCNQAVEYARGSHCWLMTDDDLLLPGAIDRVLAAIDEDYSLILVDAEVKDQSLTNHLLKNRMGLLSDRSFDESQWQEFVQCAGNHMSFVGVIVIRKNIWMERSREKYFGVGFIHVGVILQAPLPGKILVIKDPFVSIRYGNAMWTAHSFRIWMIDWPNLIWSFDSLNDSSKTAACYRKDPWADKTKLLWLRALGRYSITEYEQYVVPREKSAGNRLIARLIAVAPRPPLYTLARLLLGMKAGDHPLQRFDLLASIEKP